MLRIFWKDKTLQLRLLVASAEKYLMFREGGGGGGKKGQKGGGGKLICKFKSLTLLRLLLKNLQFCNHKHKKYCLVPLTIQVILAIHFHNDKQ